VLTAQHVGTGEGERRRTIGPARRNMHAPSYSAMLQAPGFPGVSGQGLGRGARSRTGGGTMCVSPQSPQFEQSMAQLVECGQGIARGDMSARIYLEYAEALWNIRDLENTISSLDVAIGRAAELTPLEQSRAYASRAICYLQVGDFDAAIQDATKSDEVMPRAHPLALRALARLFQGDTDEALRDADEAARLDASDWEVRAWRGMILLEAGRYAEALDEFTWVLESGECTRYASEVHRGRARARLALGDATGAEADCDAAIDEDYHEQSHWPFIVQSRARDAYQVYLVRAEARLALGRTLLALGDCCFAASLAPAEPAVYALRARIYYALGSVQEAIKDTIRAEHLRTPADQAERVPVLAGG
jgi:tetratricopeptide (TPR) repeat protein